MSEEKTSGCAWVAVIVGVVLVGCALDVEADTPLIPPGLICDEQEAVVHHDPASCSGAPFFLPTATGSCHQFVFPGLSEDEWPHLNVRVESIDGWSSYLGLGGVRWKGDHLVVFGGERVRVRYCR